MSKLNKMAAFIALTSTASIAIAEPAAINVGGIAVLPSVSVEGKYDDNILFAETDETSSLITIISPSVQTGIQNGVNTYTLQAGLQAGFYAGSSEDNYLDSQIQGNIHHEFTRKNKIDLNLQYAESHEARGTGFSQGTGNALTEPDKFHTISADGAYTYGSKEAIGRITLSAGGLLKRYDSRRAITEARDRDTINVGATFFYHIQPKTSLLFELRRSQIDYKLSAATLDSIENRFFIGAEWEATAMTSGSIRAGLLQKKFDTNLESYSGFSWEIGAVWSPLSYSQLALQTRGKTEETNGVGNFIDSKTATLSWSHSWSTHISTNIDTSVTKNNYNPSTQEEGIVSAGAAINYEMRRWLTLSLRADHSQRQSNRVNQDYKKNVISANVFVTL